MRLTIERLRTLVLAAGVVLVVALFVFLGTAKFRNRFLARELPKRLGVDVRQEANGVTYSHALGAHSQFKIHASKAEQLKNGLVPDEPVVPAKPVLGESETRTHRFEAAVR